MRPEDAVISLHNNIATYTGGMVIPKAHGRQLFRHDDRRNLAVLYDGLKLSTHCYVY